MSHPSSNESHGADLDADNATIQRLRAERDSLAEENKTLRRLLAVALPHVEASAEAEHMLDGFKRRRRPLDSAVDEIRTALDATTEGEQA